MNKYNDIKEELNAHIKEIYQDAEDIDGFAIKEIKKRELVDELIHEYKVTERTAYRWLRYLERDFGANNQRTKGEERTATFERALDYLNHGMHCLLEKPGSVNEKLDEIKKISETFGKLKKLSRL
tara:strand:+ start:700 stop:1074 length:375 start_codon:yes stop_codon:yes gene_type:complete